MWVRRGLAFLLLVLVLGAAGFVALAWHSEITPAEPPARSAFDPKLLERGAQYAALGNCNACHTANGGQSFAGGLAIPTPFGTIHSTNITPDRNTGIGRWSEQAFSRSMREGVSRDGRLLYPAFPYDHFTKITDEDNRALYAFLMTREPVRAQAPANDLRFPFNVRPLLAGWNLLFLRKGAYQPNPSQSAEWNRGAYLVRSRPLRRMPHAAQRARRREARCRYGRCRFGGLVRPGAEC